MNSKWNQGVRTTPRQEVVWEGTHLFKTLVEFVIERECEMQGLHLEVSETKLYNFILW